MSALGWRGGRKDGTGNKKQNHWFNSRKKECRTAQRPGKAKGGKKLQKKRAWDRVKKIICLLKARGETGAPQ